MNGAQPMTRTTCVLLSSIVLAACGGSGGDHTPPVDAGVVDTVATDAPHAAIDAPVAPDAPTGSSLVLNVPGTYTGSPRQLAIIGAKQVPVAGPPDTVFLLDSHPAPHAGQPLALTLDTASATGELYVVVVLYQQGGGQYSPKSGVDYVAQSAHKFTFTGAPQDLGALDLVIAP